MNKISSYTRITLKQVTVNGVVRFENSSNQSASTFLTEIYKASGISYPKFHKMDLMSRLGWMAAELTWNALGKENLNIRETAIVLANRASSLETDKQYQNSIQNKNEYFPSPAVFVYTLPNIVMGEIAIRHKITGENAFFVSDEFDAGQLFDYTEILMETGASDSVLAGWVNVDGENFEGLIYLVEKHSDSKKNSNFKAHSKEIIKQLYY